MTLHRVQRSLILSILESVSPGLATRELIQQGTCFVFTGGRVHKFNDEISCFREFPVPITGAVKAKSLLDLLSKMSEDEIEIDCDGTTLQIKGKGKKCGLTMEADILLPIESVEDAVDWSPVAQGFSEAVGIVHSCASTEESTFVLTCIRITPDFLEATDQYQVARYQIETGVKNVLLVRAECLKKLTSLDIQEVSESGSWLHFRNQAGLQLSCRKYQDKYPELDRHIESLGDTKITLPGGLKEVVDRCSIFSSENASGSYVLVEIQPDRIIISGEGPSGWYKEMKKTTFSGEPIKFSIAPKLLVELSSRANDCFVAPGRLGVSTGKFRYVTCTYSPGSEG